MLGHLAFDTSVRVFSGAGVVVVCVAFRMTDSGRMHCAVRHASELQVLEPALRETALAELVSLVDAAVSSGGGLRVPLSASVMR